MLHIFFERFLGKSPLWYKGTIIAFLLLNPLLYFTVGPFVTGWIVLLQFIFTLAFSLKCYPVPSGGLLALEAIFIGLASPDGVYKEIVANLPTLLLLIFMVSAIYYLKDVIFVFFTKLFLSIRKKYLLSLAFCVVSAAISAFLDALTIMAVLVAVCFNFYAIFHKVAAAYEEDSGEENEDIEEFRGFMRNIIMHGAVGTTLGGTLTLVGEPHNLMIGATMGWSFADFFLHCSVISVPVMFVGFALCPVLEIVKFPGFGYQLPEKAREVINRDCERQASHLTSQTRLLYGTQIIVGILLVFALSFHVAEVGLIGVTLIVILSAFTGKTKEHDLADAFNHAMPFVCLIVIFFAILAVVHEQHLVAPLVQWVFQFKGVQQMLALYFTNGALSCISDNVFIASLFIGEVEKAYSAGMFSYEWYEKLAVIVNMGTNIPAVATPNGQAAFLYLLTSALAPLIRLSYMAMVKLALPYTIVMMSTGALCIYFFLA